ncbi:hypothetical protein KKH43_06625 [Patescibacteria group bacterium]|nr:hypothetical protein [Patescibacteria group bacterium]
MKESIETILAIAHDYHKPLSEALIVGWVNQFPENTRSVILKELAKILRVFYFSKDRFVELVQTGYKKVITTLKKKCDNSITVGDVEFIRGYSEGGASQDEILDILDAHLMSEHGIHVDTCGGGYYFALFDDASYTGNKMVHSARRWIEAEGDKDKVLVVAPLIIHTKSLDYLSKQVRVASVRTLKKALVIAVYQVQNTTTMGGVFQGYIPAQCDNESVKAFIECHLDLGYGQRLYRPDNFIREEKFFSSKEAREIVEQQLLSSGARLINRCSSVGRSTRPMGFETLDTLGFGTPLVFYRNIPNNAPIAFWWGVGQHQPLFDRVTYADRVDAAEETDDEWPW